MSCSCLSTACTSAWSSQRNSSSCGTARQSRPSAAHCPPPARSSALPAHQHRPLRRSRCHRGRHSRRCSPARSPPSSRLYAVPAPALGADWRRERRPHPRAVSESTIGRRLTGPAGSGDLGCVDTAGTCLRSCRSGLALKATGPGRLTDWAMERSVPAPSPHWLAWLRGQHLSRPGVPGGNKTWIPVPCRARHNCITKKCFIFLAVALLIAQNHVLFLPFNTLSHNPILKDKCSLKTKQK